MKIYQSFYKPEQVASLDTDFIPYNNLKNEKPLLREYPFLLDLYDKNRNYDGYWGIVSPLFGFKTKTTGARFKELILSNPGYDVYHFNAYPQMEFLYLNPFMQADEYHHRGMANYINKLVQALGYQNFDVTETRFATEHFIYCSYYVGNSKFWDRWIPFLQACIYTSENNPELNAYLYGYSSIHDGRTDISNFSFVIERLVGLFAHLNSNLIRVKCFTS